MRIQLALFAAAAMTASAAQADSQSSNTSSNSSSNNGVVRERIIDSYCDNEYCRRSVERRVYRDDRRNRRFSERERRRYRELIIATATLATTIRRDVFSTVIPAKAGIPLLSSVRIQEEKSGIPAFARMTKRGSDYGISKVGRVVARDSFARWV